MNKTSPLIVGLVIMCFLGIWYGALPSTAQDFTSLTKSLSTVEAASLITAIDVQGNEFVPTQSITDVVFSRVGDSLLQEKIDGDLKAIYALGFFSDVWVTFEAKDQGTKVIFKVAENPIIRNVLFDGNTVYPTKKLRALIGTQDEDLLNFNALRDDIQKIADLYKNDGYMLARVADVQTDAVNQTVRFKIVEGMVEAIVLEGNESTQDYVILRELNTKPGTVLNEKRLKADLRRVFNLGFFSEVNPVFDPGSTPDKVVLRLMIKETRTSTVNFGGGYGEREGWFGFMDLSINNLFGTGQGLLLRGQSGQELSTYQLKYSNPWIFPEILGDHTAFTFRRWLTSGRDIYLTDQDAVYNGFDVSFGKPYKDFYNVALTLGSELVFPRSTATFEGYQADTVAITLSYDTRDFWLNPKEGVYYTFSLKQGWKYTSATTNFFKIGADLNQYYQAFPNQILAFHEGAGIGFEDVPLGEMYWAGGANTIRGYNVSDARKGRRRIIVNAEYRLDFSDLFQGVLFYDWGDAWDYGAPVVRNFISGWGPGARINTPMGPIRLDYGVANGKSFSEGVMHFSIGQAF
jgi:outer membrane protein insertion porin family